MILLPVYMYLETYWIDINEVVIESDQIPPEFDGKKIVFLSDIHASSFFSQSRVKNMVDQVNYLNPDIILLGGDYVSGEEKYVNSTFESLSNLKAPMGVYAVLGNSDPQHATWQALNNSFITDIGNMGTWIENGSGKIRIGGVGDLSNDWQNQEGALGNATDSHFTILVSHEPDYFVEIDKSRVDLMFSGHTHGGQVTFFGLWAPFVPSKYEQKYITGVFKEDNSTLIVSNGLGTVGLPVRFFSRPQIIVVKLKST